MAIVEGAFQNVTELFFAGGFKVVLVPEDFVATCRVQMNGDSFFVDWGDGTKIEYSSGSSPAVVPTGNIIVTSEAGTYFRNHNDTITSMTITGGEQLTNAASMCLNMTKMTSFSVDTLENVGFMLNTWKGCSGLTSFPLVDLSSATRWEGNWFGCTGLTSFPLLVSPLVTNASSAWFDCDGLTSFPLIDMSGNFNFTGTWRGCSGLTSFPLIDVSKGTNYSGAWFSCSGLTSFPSITIGNSAFNCNDAWNGCSGLATFPALDMKNTTCDGTWDGCSGITAFPACDLSGVTDLGTAFVDTAFTSFAPTDMGACLDFGNAFLNNSSLLALGNLNTDIGTRFDGMFSGCSSLATIGAIDTEATVGASTDMFLNCSSLTSPNASEQSSLENSIGFDFN